MRKYLSDATFGLALFSVLCASPAQAYLDGATISLTLQALTGAIATALLFGKIWWGKFVGIFSRNHSKTDAEG